MIQEKKDLILEDTLKSFANNYTLANNDGERFKTDREANDFIDNSLTLDELREHYYIRYEQYKGVENENKNTIRINKVRDWHINNCDCRDKDIFDYKSCLQALKRCLK